MEVPQQSSSRKKFLQWGAILFGSATFLGFTNFFWKSKNKDQKADTVKMLTQDGQLVEIDKKLLAAPGKKITNEELQRWINKK